MAFLINYDIIDPYGGDPLVAIQQLPWTCFARDAATGDLLNPPTILSGVDCVVQRINARLRHFRGEFFTDKREGVPWYRDVLKKDPDLVVVDDVIRRTILGVPGVLELTRMDLRVDRQTRTLYAENLEIRIGPPALIIRAQGPQNLVLP